MSLERQPIYFKDWDNLFPAIFEKGEDDDLKITFDNLLHVFCPKTVDGKIRYERRYIAKCDLDKKVISATTSTERELIPNSYDLKKCGSPIKMEDFSKLFYIFPAQHQEKCNSDKGLMLKVGLFVSINLLGGGGAFVSTLL